jgi:PAS domain S-box-containing protein
MVQSALQPSGSNLLLPDQVSSFDAIIDFRVLAENIPHIVWAAAVDGATTYFNQRGSDFTGLPPETNFGWGWVSLIHEEDAQRAQDDWNLAQETKIPLDTQWRVRRADGEYRRMAIRGAPVFDPQGVLIQWVGTCTDIEDEKRLEDHLLRTQQTAAESLTLLETLQASAPVGFGYVDRDFRLLRLNDSLAAINGRTVELQLGRTVAEVIPDLWAQIEPSFRKVLDTRNPVVNVEVTGRSAVHPEQIHTWLSSFHPVRLRGEIIGIGIVVVDITERRQAEEFRSIVMNQMAEGLYTLDGEGQVTYMNAAASEILGWTEEELRGKNMHDVIHFQGDDGAPQCEQECELLKVRTQGRNIRLDDVVFTRKDGSPRYVSVSGSPLLNGPTVSGVVVVFRDTSDEHSDRIRIKREIAALAWVGRIREALDENRLLLYAQPIVPLAGGQASEELLLRMEGRNGEIIPPGAFLHAAEKYGLISEIDRWVVKEAVRLAASGRHVEANLSAESISTLDLLTVIEREIYQTGADPSNLVFEITETALMGDIAKGEFFARGLLDLGCGLALDDFGTGFGTFTYLKRIPIKFLKIDIEFVRDLETNAANRHIVKAIVNLAEGFGCQTIAEGVEDEATLSVLRDFGVDFVQGFHLGRPAPIVERP